MSIFKKLLSDRRQEQHQQAIKSIMGSLFIKAEQISQRAVRFINKLKQKQAISQNLFQQWRYEIKNPSISPICSKIIHSRHNEATFRCYDCMGSVSSCICAECFANGDHKGHNYIQQQLQNGCCDCGNEQSWNEKGFCKNHGKINQLNFQIDPSVQKQYLEENGLAFWFYFYLVELKKATEYKELFGNELFTYLTNISRQNYQMKYLAFKLLSNPLPALFKDSDNDAKSSILQRIFRMDQANELGKFVQLTFQVFPVEQFRVVMLKQYFDKMKNKGYPFTSYHQLATLNFQFLSCVKLINRLIKADQLKPLSLYPYQFLGNTIDLPATFKKFYQDLDYINSMIAAKQYHILHLKMSNICDLCNYREFTAQYKKLGPDQYNKYDLDEVFLKTLASFASSIREQKKLLEKCLRQLFQYITMAQRNFISMAHERAFALLTMAYFDGDIYQLSNQETCNNFIKVIFDNDLVHVASNFNHLLKNVFRTKLNILQLKLQDDHTPHERYFLKVHPEKNFCQYLDLIFQKIILMASKSHIEYSNIVKEILTQLQWIIKKSDQFQQSEKPKYYGSVNELKEDMCLTNHIKFYMFLNFINSVTTVKIDQLVINNYIGIVIKQKSYAFYRRLLSTFKNLNNTELKNLVLSIMNNEQVLESFINQQCKVEGGKIRCKYQGQPLQTYIFLEFFKKYQRSLTKADPCFLRKSIKLPQFANYVVIDEETANSILEIIMNFVFKFTSLQSVDKFTNIFSLISFQYLKIYLENHSSKQKSFFHTLLQPSFRPLISKQLLEQITLLERQENLETQREKIKDEKQLEEKKKKQRLLAKKKQKELNMKMNQQKMLNTYETSIKEIQAEQHSNDCIYCKQPKNQSLNYISYVGITNFYEEKFMKNDDYHVFLESCGHKVHRGCFEIVLMKSKSNYCFLCKKETNMLIPQYSQRKQEISQSQIVDIIFSFQAALINQRQEIKSEFKEKDLFLMQSQKSFYELLIKGIRQDIFFIGLRDPYKYKKTRFPIHYQLLTLLKGLDRLQMMEHFANIQPKVTQRYSEIVHLIHLKLEQLVIGIYQESHQQTSQIISNYSAIVNKFFSAFFNEKDEEKSITDLNFISNQLLFTPLPDNLGRMNMYFGECKICSNMTNYIFICLKCEWSSCNKCLRHMQKHATYGHLDGTIFISCTNGAVKYLYAGRIFEDGSIYENYLKESYTEIVSYSEVSKIDKFKLNITKLQKIQEIALLYGIHQKIFLNDH